MIYRIAAVLVLVVVVWAHGNHHGKTTERLQWQEETNLAVTLARDEERTLQEKTNAALQKQFDDLAVVNSRLLSDIDRLRNRPERRPVPDNPQAECKGATGAELSRPDAEFLTRLAARADRLRAALTACYSYADGLQPN